MPFVIPIDANGEALPHDHPDLAPDVVLIRRVSEQQLCHDENIGGRRISSAFYRLSTVTNEHLSMDSTACIDAKGIDRVAYVTTPRWIGAVQLPVAAFRDLETPAKPPQPAIKFLIGMAKVPGNECHVGLWGKISNGQSKTLLGDSAWLNPIPGVAITK